MTALIGFIRQLEAELGRRAEAIEVECEALDKSTDPAEQQAKVIALASSNVLRQIALSIAAAAKKTLFA